MNGIFAFMEKYFVPVAAKIGSQKHLVALRDAFIGTMPATMAGAIAVMINAIIRDLPTEFWSNYNGNEIAVIKDIIAVNGIVWQGTLAIAGLIFAISLGYNLARTYKVNELAGSLVSVAALISGISITAELTSEAGEVVAGWGFLKVGHLGAPAFFVVMLFGGLAVWIYSKLMLANITIKMPDSVPPAVSRAFAAIIPASVALYVVAFIYWLFGKTLSSEAAPMLIDWIQVKVAQPFLNLSQGMFAVLLVSFLVSLLWFFGLHGPNVLAPVLEGIWGQAQIANVNTYQEGGMAAVKSAIEAGGGDAYLWVRASFDAYAWYGGSGGTLVLILLILVFSRRADYRTVAKLSVGPGIFNINEPVMFGLPIVLNPMMVIPFTLAPLAATTIGYLATSLGLVNPVVVPAVWVTPPFLLSFIATGADWRAPIVTLVAFVVSALIWLPFVIAANAQKPAGGAEE